MALRHNDLRAIAVFACVLAGCSASTEPSDSPDSVPVPHLSLRTDFGLELLQGEVNLTPGDSLILLATVEGSPADYGVPWITATDTAALQPRHDGTALVRRSGELSLTVTAVPKVPSARTPLLSASARLRLVCTAEMRAGILLTVLDSISGAPVTTLSTRRIRATSASRVDSAIVSPSGSLTLAGVIPTGDGLWGFAMESAGIWSVEVEADGYRAWRGDGIAVSGGLCHVITQRVVARLLRR